MVAPVKKPYEKIKHFCAYQERSHVEVKKKLYSFGLSVGSIGALMAKLIEENYLNEERFAQAFARGKFNLKKWGRVKIKHELSLKGVGEHIINTSLKEINQDDYLKTLQYLTEKKWAELADEQLITRHAKTTHFVIQKGYEVALVQKAIKIIVAKDN